MRCCRNRSTAALKGSHCSREAVVLRRHIIVSDCGTIRIFPQLGLSETRTGGSPFKNGSTVFFALRTFIDSDQKRPDVVRQ